MKTTVIIFLFFSGLSFGQSGIVVSGATATNGSGTLSYSVGQIDFQAGSGSGGSSSAGNQQPFEIFENPVNGLSSPELKITVFPNPVQQALVLEMNGISEKALHYRISDSEGKLVYEGAVNEGKNSLNVAFLQSGIYFLEITKGEALLKSFKLIKSI